jgi:flagellar biosynthesis/type III secretory pathway chaperone
MGQEKEKETYLALLEDSLIKKSSILDQLIELTNEQEIIIHDESINEERFHYIIDQKEALIEKLLSFDNGFEQIYQHIKDELLKNKGKYQKEIQRLQELIADITDKSIALQAAERRNKAKLDAYLATKRGSIKSFKISNQTATSYYKNMTGQHQGQAYFFDQKN